MHQTVCNFVQMSCSIDAYAMMCKLILNDYKSPTDCMIMCTIITIVVIVVVDIDFVYSLANNENIETKVEVLKRFALQFTRDHATLSFSQSKQKKKFNKMMLCIPLPHI